jgi:phage terminase large subunit-like protein
LEQQDEKEFYFDIEAAQHRIDFYQFCRHSEGRWAGQVFEPAPWQQFVDWNIYGWKWKKNDKRRFRTAYVEVSRKNGKSSKIATDGLYMLGYDGEHGAQVFTAATKKDQARIIHRISTRMVKASPALRKQLGTFKDSIYCESMGGTFIPLGQDSKTEDGWNVQAALVDEYHAHPDATLYDVLRSGMGSREQPLMLIITTAGFDKASACYQEREYLVSILEQTFQDESYFGIIFTVDDEDKWDDETEWLKANPNLTVSVSLDDMRDMCMKAKNSPSKQNEFKTKKLNIWTETLTRWITSEAWDACGTSVDADGLAGRTCYGAFDLSSVSDFTAWVLCFPPDVSSDLYKFVFRFFLPQYDLDKRFTSRDVLNQITGWVRQGFVTATPGNSIDYDFIMEQIRTDGERYDIKEIPYDPYNATQVVNDLMKDGFELTPFRQGYLTMSPAAKAFESAVLDKRIAHGNNPVMKWMVSCTDVQSDPAGNIKPVKPDRGKTSKRIDGVIASIMAYSRSMSTADTRSIYETRGILYAEA